MDKRNSYTYKKWREQVLERDCYMCQLCGAINEDCILHVHHIIRYTDDKELRTDINNGITLCRVCHSQIKNKESNFINIFKEIIKNPIWTRKIVNTECENKGIIVKDYSMLINDEDIDYSLLPSVSIIYIEDVSQFKIYCYLWIECDKNQNISISFKEIANNCNMASSTVQKAIKGLEDLKLIKKDSGDKYKKNIYHINYPILDEYGNIIIKEMLENS